MTNKYLLGIWDPKQMHVFIRFCNHCGVVAIPIVFGMMPSYGDHEMRYWFCSTECRTHATALRRLGLQHQKWIHDSTAVSKAEVLQYVAKLTRQEHEAREEHDKGFRWHRTKPQDF